MFITILQDRDGHPRGKMESVGVWLKGKGLEMEYLAGTDLVTQFIQAVRLGIIPKEG